MTDNHPLAGELSPLDFPKLLFRIHKSSLSGTLIVRQASAEKSLYIKDRMVVFASSNQDADSLANRLQETGLISPEQMRRADTHMRKNKLRVGRALLELSCLDYEQLWSAVRSQLKAIVFSLFTVGDATYELDARGQMDQENITLNEEIPSLILEGMREVREESILYEHLKDVQTVFPFKSELPTTLSLKAHERHILDLVSGESRLKQIISRSELLKFDTLRILYTFLLLELISPEEVEPAASWSAVKRAAASHRDVTPLEEGIPPVSSFLSFEEALKHFNMKYEMIYRVLSKEIGPIALSILNRAVMDVSEKLPFFLKKVSLRTEGGLDEKPVLQAVWYYDFERYCGDFVKGLEEILYAEIYAVKRHLGVEFEHQILKWIH